MSRRRRVLHSWSSGKDAAWALERLLADDAVEVVGLLTTVTEAAGRVSMHGVRRELCAAQCAALGLRWTEVVLPSPCPDTVYEERMAAALAPLLDAGLEAVSFGDLFLEDVRRYREDRLARVGLTARFPLWGEATDELAEAMLDAGLEAWVACVDLARLPLDRAGLRFDRGFLDGLPAGVDPCGENGEFHSFVAWAPSFTCRVPVRCGGRSEQDGFGYADLLPA